MDNPVMPLNDPEDEKKTFAERVANCDAVNAAGNVMGAVGDMAGNVIGIAGDVLSSVDVGVVVEAAGDVVVAVVGAVGEVLGAISD